MQGNYYQNPSKKIYRYRENYFIYIYIYKLKGKRIAKLILKKNKEEGILLPDFMTYHAATLIKTYCWINGLENPKIEL